MKKQLGELLLEEGVITREELQEVLKIQKKSPLKMGQILIKKGLVDEEQILETLARQYGYNYESRLNFKYDDTFGRIPVNLIHRSRLVPIERKGQTVRVAIADPANLHPMDDMRLCLKDFRVEFILAPETEIMRVIHGSFDQAAAAAREVMDGMGEDEYSEFADISEDTLDMANEAPIIRMVNAILTQGVQERASDIHVEPFEKHLDVRYRIDGILHRRLTPPKMIHPGLVSRIKIMANLNIAENRLPQDGRIKIKLSGKEVDIRVSTIPTQYGERVVMRLLNKSDVRFSMDTMGFLPRMKSDLETVILEPNGIVLVTGPTGSGKSTTLYAVLSQLNTEGRNILTAEDPVEYEIDGIGQMHMHEKIGLTFASALRAMLRQDPDVIMVGEIRDQETARISIQAALTGHLVLSTLHTNDAPSAVTRLIDMGIEPYLITSTVRAVLAQRLVRVICPACKTAYTPTARELSDFGLSAKELKNGKLYRGQGCDECVGTGYRGRSGIYSLMLMSTEVQRSILKGDDADQIADVAAGVSRNPMMSLSEYGRIKVVEGMTTIEEVMRVT
ncbi:MAG: type II secretion system ATPase GspE [Leptospiraceae bacterium]|nr:type II secretion system ATPase GspE [Leptospiraceae bacterium]